MSDPLFNRVVILETVYHQREMDNPVSVTHNYVKKLQNNIQPYSRELDIGKEWKAVDFGWISDPVLVLLKNIGLRKQVPDIELGIVSTDGVIPFLAIAYQESVRLSKLIYPGGLFIRGVEETRAMLTAFSS